MGAPDEAKRHPSLRYLPSRLQESSNDGADGTSDGSGSAREGHGAVAVATGAAAGLGRSSGRSLAAAAKK